MTQIFLGYPPEHIKNWIIEYSKPAGNPKTKITFTNGDSKEYDWSKEINFQTMIDAGLYDKSQYDWVKNPQIVEIGTNVTSIGSSAFRGCSGLTSVTIPSSVTSIGNEAFTHCSSLTSVTILEGVTSIGDQVFEGCSSLTSVTIPEGVTSIGFAAFGDCSSLTSVMISSSVTNIGGYVFSGCSGLTSVTFSGKDMESVQNMANYSWSLTLGCVIHCTNGDITI